MAAQFFRVKPLTAIQIPLLRKNSNKKIKQWGVMYKSTYFLTTPIFYVNAEPHIGHLYTAVIADSIARFERIKNPDVKVKFMTGTDEHGLKISKSALKCNMSEQVYCDMISEKFRELFKLYDVNETDFLRTTEERHIKAVTSLWERLQKNGYIYQGEYSGWYCLSDEAFVGEEELDPNVLPNGTRVTRDSKKPVELIKEKNYKFKLSHFKNDLLHWINSGNVVKPENYKKTLEEMLNSEAVMSDLSISRPVERVTWGIPVPNDDSQCVYVWLDALTCYLTTNGFPNNSFQWPPDLQIVGKDILKFHGIFWPAFLIGAGLEPPKCILCHSHWLKDGEKMSKSKGNVVDPFLKYDDFTCDGFRYFLLRRGVPQQDSNYSESEIIDVINAELADTMGNLLSRSCGSVVNKKQIFPRFCKENHDKYCRSSSKDLTNALNTLPSEVLEHYNNFEFYKGIAAVMNCLRLTNKMFDVEKPWELRKDPRKLDHLNAVLHVVMETLRVCGILLQPVIPTISNNLLNKLSIGKNERNFDNIRPYSWEKPDESSDLALLSENIILFRKLKAAKN